MKKRFLIFCLLFMVSLTPVMAKEPEDFYFEVAEGGLHDSIHKFGVNHAVGTSYEDIWSGDGTYIFPSAATLMNVTSEDTDDAAGGTGAWNITIFGLDADYLEINETIQLNGQTPVSTTKLFLRIFRAYVLQAGSQATNDGAIWVGTGATASGVPTNKFAHIEDTHGQTLTTIYTVPVNKTAFMTEIYFTSSEDKAVEYELMWREFGSIFRVKDEIFTFRTVIQLTYVVPRAIPQKSDIRVRGEVGVGTGDLGVGYNLVLVNNEDLGLSTEDVNVNVTNTPLNVNVTGQPIEIEGQVTDQTSLFAVLIALVVGGLFLMIYGRN